MEIPASVTSINESAFCPNNNTTIPDFINKLTFAENSSCLKINRYAFTGAISLKSVSLPEKITMLGDYTFDACSSLTSVDLSNCIDLSSINDFAFRRCSALSFIIFPSSLTKIGANAFLDTSNLSSITWDAWQGGTTLGSNSFSGVCPTGGTVTVTNPKDDQHNSSALLQYLFNGGLPNTWS